MMWQFFISAFILGLISSLHCVGMCGPLALSLPMAGYTTFKKILGILLYNFGRVTTYSILGLFFGFAGRQIFIAGYQQIFSIIIGLFILFFFIVSVINKKTKRLKIIDSLYSRVQLFVSQYLKVGRLYGMYLTGVANGLLPCAMVYLAITGAMAGSNVLYGMEFMAAFGLGTIPAMLVLSVAGIIINIQARRFIRRLTPYAFLLMSVL